MTNTGAPAAEALSRLSNGLRSPLALIAGYADLLELRRDAETLSEVPQRIKESRGRSDPRRRRPAHRLRDRCERPLSGARAGTLADEAVALARDRGTIVSLEADRGSRDTELLADPEYAGSMLSTLLENARLRAANAGATLHVRRISGFVELEVANHGGAGLTTGLELCRYAASPSCSAAGCGSPTGKATKRASASRCRSHTRREVDFGAARSTADGSICCDLVSALDR